MKNLKNLATAGTLTLALMGAMHQGALAQNQMPMSGKTPMSGMMDGKMGGKMSMSDKKMMPQMMKGMPKSDHAMMMQMCTMMMPSMSAAQKKTLMGMSVAEKKVMMAMCNKMMPGSMAKSMGQKPMSAPGAAR